MVIIIFPKHKPQNAQNYNQIKQTRFKENKMLNNSLIQIYSSISYVSLKMTSTIAGGHHLQSSLLALPDWCWRIWSTLLSKGIFVYQWLNRYTNFMTLKGKMCIFGYNFLIFGFIHVNIFNFFTLWSELPAWQPCVNRHVKGSRLKMRVKSVTDSRDWLYSEIKITHFLLCHSLLCMTFGFSRCVGASCPPSPPMASLCSLQSK